MHKTGDVCATNYPHMDPSLATIQIQQKHTCVPGSELKKNVKHVQFRLLLTLESILPLTANDTLVQPLALELLLRNMWVRK